MKNIFLIIGYILLFQVVFLSKITIATSQEYNIVIDTEGRSGFGDSQKDSEGNIILCGASLKLPDLTTVNGILLKIYPDGDTLVRNFNFLNDTMSSFGQIVILPDSNYMVFGAIGKKDSIDDFKEMKNIWVLKLDQELNTIWDKRYELPGDYWNPGYRVWLSNETIYAAGNVDWWNGYHRVNYFMAKFNLDGDTLKTAYPFIDDPMQFPLGGIEGGIMGRANGQEGLVAVGSGFTPTVEHEMVEVDSNLNYTLTALTYPYNYTLMLPSIKRISDTQYLWASNVHLTYQGNEDIIVAKVNGNQVFVDQTIYGRADTTDFPAVGKGIDFYNPDNIFVASINNHFPDDPLDTKVSIALFDSNLNMKGWKWFGGDMNYYMISFTTLLVGFLPFSV